MPKINKWKSPQFDKCRETIKQKYLISNHEFSDALELIKKHRTLCLLIGLENKYKSFSKDFFKIYKEFYQCSSINKINNTKSLSRFVADDLQQGLNEYSKRELFIKAVSKEDIKLLYLFFVYGQDNCIYVEQIDTINKGLENDDSLLNDYARNLLSKHALEFICLGMQKTGQKTYLAEFKKIFNLA